MMMRGLMVGAALTLAACTSGPQAARSFDDPAVQKLFAMPTAQYFATIQVANQVAQNCARYRYDAVLDAQLNERRNEVGRGTLSAQGLTNQIELENDVAQRSFTAKHGVELGSGADLCPAADAETQEGGALSAMLVPVA